jgi:hypothetical protein
MVCVRDQSVYLFKPAVPYQSRQYSSNALAHSPQSPARQGFPNFVAAVLALSALREAIHSYIPAFLSSSLHVNAFLYRLFLCEAR